MYIKRTLEDVVERITKSFSVLMLTGPRQAGKTTLLKHADPGRRFVTLDDLEQRTLAQEHPALFLERHPAPVLIDEFQYAPQLLPYIKIAVDAKKTRRIPCMGEYWLTGSQNFSMMEGVQESLAGRVAVLKLLGLDLAESQDRRNRRNGLGFFERQERNFEIAKSPLQLFEIILAGDKPEIWAHRAMDRQQYYISTVQTYLERDVQSQLGVRQLGKFERFMRLLATRATQLLNMSRLASDVGVTVPTIHSWLTILERSFQITMLQPYYRNLGKRQVKTPKVYFLDTGLVTHLLKWTDPLSALNGQMAGALFENWVVSEIIKSYWHRGEDPSLFFWRTREGDEIDLVQEKGGELHAAEIKLSDKPRPDVFAPLDSGRKGAPLVRTKRLISPVQRSYALNRDTEVVSAWDL